MVQHFCSASTAPSLAIVRHPCKQGWCNPAAASASTSTAWQQPNNLEASNGGTPLQSKHTTSSNVLPRMVLYGQSRT